MRAAACLNAARLTGEDPSPNIGETYPPAHHHGGLRLCGVHRPRSTFRNLADHTRCTSLASGRLVDTASAVHPPARIDGLASHRRRLARRALPVLRRHAVPRLDVGVGRWPRPSVFVVAEGAALSVLEGLVEGRRQLVGVGNALGVWASMSC